MEMKEINRPVELGREGTSKMAVGTTDAVVSATGKSEEWMQKKSDWAGR